MATVENRYQAATEYVRRAIDAVERAPSAFNVVDRYAATLKTKPARDELARLDAVWLRAANDLDRVRAAQAAELLADRTEESLPGAPQDWRRTNLYAGERPSSTPATSYRQELAGEAQRDWDWFANEASGAANFGKGIAQWVLIGGGLLLAIKAVDYLRVSQEHNSKSTARELNEGLERAAADVEHIDR